MKKIFITVVIFVTIATGCAYYNAHQSIYSQVGKLIENALESNDAKEINNLLQEAKENAEKIGINDAEFFSQIQIAINVTDQNIDLAKIAVSQIEDPTNAHIWSKYWWVFVAVAALWVISNNSDWRVVQ